MPYANEIMHPDPVVVRPDATVRELARILLDHEVEGLPVVEDGRVVGVVTAMDLIFQEKRVHLPSFVTLLETVVPVAGKAAVRDLDKLTGSLVRDIMSRDPVTVSFDASLGEMATLMVEKHISILPVLKDGALVGVVNKRDVLCAAFPGAPPEEADTDEVIRKE